jgi:hypothetical protein
MIRASSSRVRNRPRSVVRGAVSGAAGAKAVRAGRPPVRIKLQGSAPRLGLRPNNYCTRVRRDKRCSAGWKMAA